MVAAVYCHRSASSSVPGELVSIEERNFEDAVSDLVDSSVLVRVSVTVNVNGASRRAVSFQWHQGADAVTGYRRYLRAARRKIAIVKYHHEELNAELASSGATPSLASQGHLEALLVQASSALELTARALGAVA